VDRKLVETACDDLARAAAVLFRADRLPVSVSVCYSDSSAWQPSLDCVCRTPADCETVLAQLLRAALAQAHSPERRLVCVAIWFSDHTWLQSSLPPLAVSEAVDREQPGQCEHDIRKVLRAANQRLTTSAILRALEARHMDWGESTVKRALAAMVRRGELTNRSDLRPRGYGLPGS